MFVTLGYAFVGYSHCFRRRTCHTIRKFVHYEMAMHRQASAVLVICQIKKLLKELGIKDTDQEVKARIVVWYQSEQSDLLFSQTWQVKLIGGGKPCKALQIEFFKPSGKGYLDTL